MAGAAAVAVIVVLSSTAAMAVTFNAKSDAGWLNNTGTCNEGGPCLGFATQGAFGATSSLELNWDNQTDAQDSFLRVGALPDGGLYPQATALTTIAPGETKRIFRLQHENNVIPGEDDFLASIVLRTLVALTGPANEPVLSLPLDVPVGFIETTNIDGESGGGMHAGRALDLELR